MGDPTQSIRDGECNMITENGLTSTMPAPEPISSDKYTSAPEHGEADTSDNSDAESIGGQRETLSGKRMLISIVALSVCLFVSFIDQTSVSTATPALASELDTGTSTSWIGTSFLIASTAFQLVNGRLSDIFGRKNLLIICLLLMAAGDLACGFAKTAVQLFVFRSVAGVGGGGINSLVMIIVSDITTLQNRGHYQGILGAVIALANGIGPFLGGAIVQSSTWRWVFWMIPLTAAPTTLVIWFYLPLKHRSGEYMNKVKKIDFGGTILNIASTLLLLIPLSGGGVTYAWTSPFFISTIAIGFVWTVLFVLYEWKLARLPIMPLRLYRAPHCWALYIQSFLTGLAYFGNFFYLPLYFQSVLGYSALIAGALILAIIIPTSFTSIISGQYMARIGSYMHCIFGGFALWTLGNGLTLLFNRDTGLGTMIAILIIEGCGIGFTLQPTLVGMYANGRSEDRAVTTGLRNYIRTIGGAFGLVVSGVVLSNTLDAQLAGHDKVTRDIVNQLTSSTYSLDSMGLTEEYKDLILEVYMQGLRYIFAFYTTCSGLSLVLTFWVGNTSLKANPKDDGRQTSSGPNDEESAPRLEPEKVSVAPQPNGRLQLTDDLTHDLPEYAILSHTWGANGEEVTYSDIVHATGKDKAGYQKLTFCAEQARLDGLQYFWVDTCCIDKANNNELSTAINSMFRWYKNAVRCYVYLEGITSARSQEPLQTASKWEQAFRSWTCRRPSGPSSATSSFAESYGEPPAKLRRLESSSTTYSDDLKRDSNVCWPRDLIPLTVPDARVLTFSYETIPAFAGVLSSKKETIQDIAWDLLISLETFRRSDPSRPIVFAAHNLGGILIKEALVRSESCETGKAHLRGIYESTAGIIFFGTPHKASNLRGVCQGVAANLAKCSGIAAGEQVISRLIPDNEHLTSITNMFNSMAQQEQWRIYSFQELFHTDLLSSKVIDDFCGQIGIPSIETMEHIERNHVEMCRFDSFDDSEYRKVVEALDRMQAAAAQKSLAREQPSISSSQKQILMDSLKFDQLDARQTNIKNAHSKTCRWLLAKSQYLAWLNPLQLGQHHGLLWIKGKPGCGKSTLMKFTLANARKSMKNALILSFFFNARGSDLEKSVVGTYRSLLWQLLKQRPALQDVFHSLEISTRTSDCPQWGIESLKELIEQSVRGLAPGSTLVFFIDALDECDERQIRDMISFFENLAEVAQLAGISFRTCFSSRHYPHIISKGIDLVLEAQEEHSNDISSYLDAELRIDDVGIATRIRAELLHKASGVFMWVVLVVDILNKEYAGGRIHKLQQRLQKIPGDLHELFLDILTRDNQDSGEMLLCIQWVLFARQPLKPEQLYFAILSGVEPEDIFEWNPDEITPKVMQRFILDASKGLAEITRAKSPTVQFIHESVKDFLLKENGLKGIWPKSGNFLGDSHERLKQCCSSYMNDKLTAHLNLQNELLPSANTHQAAELRLRAIQKYPFLEYATRNIFFHADLAQDNGVSQAEFLDMFPLYHWIGLNNLFETRQVRRCHSTASFAYIFSERNLAALITTQSKHSCFAMEDGRYGAPIFAALATNSEKVVRKYVENCLEKHPRGSLLYDLCQKFIEKDDVCAETSRQFSFSQKKTALLYILQQYGEEFLAFYAAARGVNTRDEHGRSVLSHAAEKGYHVLVEALLSDKNVEVDIRDDSGCTALRYAIHRENEAIVRTLLDHGANIESRDPQGLTPISHAAMDGYAAIVSLLLEKGCKITAKDNNGRTALSLACSVGHEDCVFALLNHGAYIESKDLSGRTALSFAAGWGHQQITRALFNHGAEVDSRDNSGKSPLWWAVRGGHETIILQLLEWGANIELKNDLAQTPLLWAVIEGNEGVVNLLLQKGANTKTKDSFGRTPLWHAEKKGLRNIIMLLLAYDARPSMS
ncbi:Ankyrin repeat domain-containing protein 50 [Paramyrothecium foliicola]|nr:Ankyrin repeat domain-containing protein 50 [Paramyrothecium foliicola]